MAGSRRDLKQLIRATLLANADVVALVGDRVYGAHKLDADEGSFETPALIFDFETGNLEYFKLFQDQFFSLYAYSRKSLDEASEIYDVALEALQGEPFVTIENVDMCGLSREVSRAEDGWNEAIKSHYARGRWTAYGIG